ETDAELRPIVEEFIFRLTGKPTIFQMMELAEHVRLRGGAPLQPSQYKQQFLDALQDESDRRMKDLRGGEFPPDIHMVPGARAVLEDLRQRGLRLYMVSGTDDSVVQEEARLLDVARYFDGGVYGSPGDDSSFSKRGLALQVVAQGEAEGPDMLSFGDGHVE